MLCLFFEFTSCYYSYPNNDFWRKTGSPRQLFKGRKQVEDHLTLQNDCILAVACKLADKNQLNSCNYCLLQLSSVPSCNYSIKVKKCPVIQIPDMDKREMRHWLYICDLWQQPLLPLLINMRKLHYQNQPRWIFSSEKEMVEGNMDVLLKI